MTSTKNKILRLIEDALAHDPTTNPMHRYGLDALKAGVGVQPRDQSREEREAARERKIINDRRSRAKRRDRMQRQEVDTDERQIRPADPRTVYEEVMEHMLNVITDTARAKAQRIARHIGQVAVEDVVSDTIERVARAFAKYDVDVESLRAVALDMRDRKSLPRDLDGLAKVMAQTINIQATKAASQWWRDNPTIDSIERLGTMERNAWGEDELVAHAAAKGDLNIVGWSPAGPGDVDHGYVAHAIHAIIEMRELNEAADIILGHEEDDEGNIVPRIKTDGTFPWYRYCEELWEACGLNPTALETIPTAKRGKAIQTAVRNRFTLANEVCMQMYTILSEFDHDLNGHA